MGEARADLEFRLRQQMVALQLEAVMMLRSCLEAETTYINRWGDKITQPNWDVRSRTALGIIKELQNKGPGLPPEALEILIHGVSETVLQVNEARSKP
jgi:hypothetical protein